MAMHRPSAQEFLQALLEALDDLPADFARRLEEVLKQEHLDRSQALRQLFEEFAGD
jgi:predicted Zn-dependent protease with MMP-like domain